MATYVLIDPLGGDPVANAGLEQAGNDLHAFRERAWGRKVAPVMLAKSVGLSPHQCPYLVTLNGPDDPWLELTLQIADEERAASQSGGLDGNGGAAHRIGGWLQADAGFNDLASCISTMCRVNTEAITGARYLRHADRRVVDFLCHVAGTVRVAGQFGRLKSWSYLDPIARIRRIDSIGEQTEALRLSRQEWRRIVSAELVHRSVAKFLGELERAGTAFPPSVYCAAEQASAEVASAVRRWPHRLAEPDDRTTWAALTMLYPGLERIAAVRDALDEPAVQTVPSEPLRYLHRDIGALAEAARADVALPTERGVTS